MRRTRHRHAPGRRVSQKGHGRIENRYARAKDTVEARVYLHFRASIHTSHKNTGQRRRQREQPPQGVLPISLNIVPDPGKIKKIKKKNGSEGLLLLDFVF
jgi:hypothetical protein